MPRPLWPLLLFTLAACHGNPAPITEQELPRVAVSPTAAVDTGTDSYADVQPDEAPDDGPTVTLIPGDPEASTAPILAQPPGRTATLPNGREVRPAGSSLVVGNLPFDCALSPDGRWLAVLHGGQHAHGVDLVDTTLNEVVQTVGLKDSFRGLAWGRDSKRLYVSGSSDAFVQVLDLQGGKLKAQRLGHTTGHAAGIAVAADGTPFVCDDTTDRLHRLTIGARPDAYFDVGKTPFAVAADERGTAYVACWGSRELTTVTATGAIAHVPVGSHPTAVALRPGHSEAWVANANDDTLTVVDTAAHKVLRTVALPAYPDAPIGASPTALAFAPDGARLYVALSGANAVAVVDPTAGTLLGRIPTAWYPSGLAVAPDGKRLYVTCAKGFGQGPRKDEAVWAMKGAVLLIPTPDAAALPALTRQSDAANRFDAPMGPVALPPIKHVVYVLRENRSYDQVLGDVQRGEGDASLCIYGREVTPNLHALAERFAFGDHFFCDGEVSAQGHQWAQGANASDAVERLYPAAYAKEGRWADASQRTLLYPDTDYLIERCVKKGVGVRVYGEPLRREREVSLKGVRSPTFKGWDLDYPDLKRVEAWEAEFKAGIFPAYSHVWLMRDHTLGTHPFTPTPRAMVAENDAATGRLLDVMSHDPRWKDTLVIITEDDAQGGYDHVDGHRSLLVLASPWIKGGALTSRHYSQVSLVATVSALLGLGSLSQYDARSPIIDDVWASTPDLRPFEAKAPQVSLLELNRADAPLAAAFAHFDFDSPDEGDQDLLARALWLDARNKKGAP